MGEPLTPEVKEAARVLLEHAARACVRRAVTSLGRVRSVFVVRSGGLDQLGALLQHLRASVPEAEVHVLGRPGDAAAMPHFWAGAWTCCEIPGEGPLSWTAIEGNAALRAAADVCDTHLFLMRNASATGYDNVQDIMSRLAAGRWFGVTPDTAFVEFDKGALAELRANSRLRDAIVEWASSGAE